MMFYVIPLIMFFCGLLVFSFSYNHFLITLLSLEYIVLSLFLLIFIYMFFSFFDLYFLMIMLAFWVCEATLGLSLLVSMIRGYGNDYFFSFNLVQC
uniref:NADH-ubiquinone oxidoreductase chain 4L n=1 Tax=Phraortes sp. Iriomote Island TaxID=590991 RepID=E2RUW6_9NEOP|nr:NADH dehydrogenase subunit 4L [Phraortes sp. Iriomote Island]BAJ24500.1 NADH dehydrogenase subunit 4L [Phraortes sp. Iriomote Island]